MIGFFTRSEPNFEDGAKYSVKVKIGNEWLGDDTSGTFCGGKCIFHVRLSLSLLNLEIYVAFIC